MEAVAQNGWTLQYVPKTLKTPELCLVTVKENGDALRYAPGKLKHQNCVLQPLNAMALHSCMFLENPYQTRDTYTSMMLTAGESPVWLAQQMGHRDWTMIARVYGKWIKDAVPDTGIKAVSLFGKSLASDSENAVKKPDSKSG